MRNFCCLFIGIDWPHESQENKKMEPKDWVLLQKSKSPQVSGPFTKTEIFESLAGGRITKLDWVWRRGMSQWKQIQHVFFDEYFPILEEKNSLLDEVVEQSLIPIKTQVERPTEARSEDLIEFYSLEEALFDIQNLESLKPLSK